MDTIDKLNDEIKYLKNSISAREESFQKQLKSLIE
jgi:peptidoglycan hydrolase CwlO-like protein